MSEKPEDIPQDVWAIAWKLQGETEYDNVAFNGGTTAELLKACVNDAMAIARAILAAEQRGAEKEREAAARILEKRLEEIVDEHGDYEPDTNYTNLPEWAESLFEEIEPLIEAIRARSNP